MEALSARYSCQHSVLKSIRPQPPPPHTQLRPSTYWFLNTPCNDLAEAQNLLAPQNNLQHTVSEAQNLLAPQHSM